MLFFDLEFYVPKKYRSKSKTSLVFRAPSQDNTLLGGVFVRVKTYRREKDIPPIDKYEKIWIWNQETFSPDDMLAAEKEVIKKIYDYFVETWQKEYEEYYRHRLLKAKKNQKSSPPTFKYTLKTCGTGISRVDLPTLYIKAVIHNIAPPEKLFEAFLATHPIDLTNVVIPLIPPKKGTIIKPIPSSEIYRHFGIKTEKTPGKTVWEQFENKQYEKIEERTIMEVKNNIEVFYKLKDQILASK